MSEPTKRLQIAGSISAAPSDLSVNDPTSPDYVKNRTHWEETVQVPLDIQWDGNLDNKQYIYTQSIADGTLLEIYTVKVSDITPTDEELERCTVVSYLEENLENAFAPERITTNNSNNTNDMAMVVRDISEMTEIMGTLEEWQSCGTGIYFSYALANGVEIGKVSRLYSDTVTMPSTVIHKIPEKYLPDGVPYTENLGETVILPETTLTSPVTELTSLLGFVEGEKYRVTYRGKEYECVCKPVEFIYDGNLSFGYGVGNAAILDMDNEEPLGLENTGEPFVIGDCWNVTAGGLVVGANIGMIGLNENTDADSIISVTYIAQEVHKVSEKYLPPRTHWAEETDVPLDITLDTDNLFHMFTIGRNVQTFVRVSDRVLTDEEILKCTLVLSDGTSMTIPAPNNTLTGCWNVLGCVLVVYNADLAAENLQVPVGTVKTGIYFACTGDDRVARLYSDTVTMPGVVYHKLPPEYMPEIPEFDLIAMGLPDIPMDGTETFVECDTTKLCEALMKGLVRISYRFLGTNTTISTNVNSAFVNVDGGYSHTLCSRFWADGAIDVYFNINPGNIIAFAVTQNTLANAEEVDF